MNKFIPLIALVGMFSSAAFAGGSVGPIPVEPPAVEAPAPVAAPVAIPVAVAPAFVPSWYVGAGVGYTSINHGGSSETSEKAFAGVRFHPNFAVEATGIHMGSGVNSANLDAKGILPVGYNLDVYGKAGVADTRVSGLGSKAGANYGVGANYHFNDKLSARLEAEQTNKIDAFGDKANTFTIGGKYSF